MKKNPKIIYGILGTIIVVLLVVLAVVVRSMFDGGNSNVSEALVNGELDSIKTVSPTAGTEDNGIYAEYTEPTEEPIDIYYVENNFDAAASDIKPTVSEEGWYIENIGCLEGAETSEFVYDEEHIRGFENGVFEAMRKCGYENIKEISRLTIDTRTVYPNRLSSLVFVSLNIGSGYGLLIEASDIASFAYGTGIEVAPIINKNRDYIINLQYLKTNEEFQWSEKRIVEFQKALYTFINEEEIEMGMSIIDPVLLHYNEEEKCYILSIDTYTTEAMALYVKYYDTTNKYVFEKW